MTAQDMQTINLRKARASDEVLRDTFVFIRVMLKPLLRSMLPIAAPFLLLTAILMFAFAISTQNIESLFVENGLTDLTAFLFITVGFITVFVLSYFLLFASGSVFMVLYTQYGKAPTPAEVWSHTKRNLLRLLSTGLFASLVTALSFVFFIIPGIYVSVALWIIFIMRLQEDIDIFDAVSRCFELVKGYWWQTFGLFLIFQLLYAVADYATELPIRLLDIIAPATVIGDTPSLLIIALLTSFSLVLTILSSLPLIVAPAFQYYNLVERKEAFGLREKIDGIVSEEEGAGTR